MEQIPRQRVERFRSDVAVWSNEQIVKRHLTSGRTLHRLAESSGLCHLAGQRVAAAVERVAAKRAPTWIGDIRHPVVQSRVSRSRLEPGQRLDRSGYRVDKLGDQAEDSTGIRGRLILQLELARQIGRASCRERV